jgi:hypothetical protein
LNSDLACETQIDRYYSKYNADGLHIISTHPPPRRAVAVLRPAQFYGEIPQLMPKLLQRLFIMRSLKDDLNFVHPLPRNPAAHQSLLADVPTASMQRGLRSSQRYIELPMIR